MSKAEYLSVFGAILFGLAASFFLISWARLAQQSRLFKEWKFMLWSIPFFLITIIVWYADYELIAGLDNFWSYLFSFISIGFLFLVSAIINPDLQKDVGWDFLRKRTDEVATVFAIGSVWDYIYSVWYLGQSDTLVNVIGTFVIVGIVLIWYFVREQWLMWVFLAIIYIQVISTMSVIE